MWAKSEWIHGGGWRSTLASGITGHVGIAVSNNQVMHFANSKTKPAIIHVNTWFANYHSNKVVRISSSTKTQAAANYAANYPRNIEYRINHDIRVTNPSYCSKLVYHAYAHGTNVSPRLGTSAISPPYNFFYKHSYPNDTAKNVYKRGTIIQGDL